MNVVMNFSVPQKTVFLTVYALARQEGPFSLKVLALSDKLRSLNFTVI